MVGKLVRKVVEIVFAIEGHPALLHTDNGSEFANKALEAECRQWGTYMVHGRPYHPQSQGVIEKPNGVLKRVIRGWQANNVDNTNWVHALHQAVRLLNEQVHSVTGMVPNDHFEKYNHYVTKPTPLPAHEPVVITVKDALHMPQLDWVAPVEVEDYDRPTATDDSDDETKETTAAVIAPAPTSSASSEDESTPHSGAPWAETTAVSVAGPGQKNVTTDSSRDTTSISASGTTGASPPIPSADGSKRPPSRLNAATRQRRPEARPPVVEARLSILPIAVLGQFNQPEWVRDLVPAVRSMLRPMGCLADGDCGPATAHAILHDSVATSADVSTMRRRVRDWSFTTTGQVYYANHSEGERRQPVGPLESVQEAWAVDRESVSPEFFTCFGGMSSFNVFMLCRTIAANGTVHCGIFIVTNGGTVVQTDDDNCVCVHYQTQQPGGGGHWEPVQDRRGRRRWNFSDPVVQDCLWLACTRLKVARSVRDARKKMLVAARNRINNKNETIKEGDFVWLTVSDAVVNTVIARARRKGAKQIAAENKMLAKVSRVLEIRPDADEEQWTTASQQFVLWCADGRMEGAYPINELRLCHPTPEPSVYPLLTMSVPIGDEPAGNSKVLKLPSAFYKHVMFLSTRTAIASQNRAHEVRVALRQRAAASAACAPASESAAPEAEHPHGDGDAPSANSGDELWIGSNFPSSPPQSPRREVVQLVSSSNAEVEPRWCFRATRAPTARRPWTGRTTCSATTRPVKHLSTSRARVAPSRSRWSASMSTSSTASSRALSTTEVRRVSFYGRALLGWSLRTRMRCRPSAPGVNARTRRYSRARSRRDHPALPLNGGA